MSCDLLSRPELGLKVNKMEKSGRKLLIRILRVPQSTSSNQFHAMALNLSSSAVLDFGAKIPVGVQGVFSLCSNGRVYFVFRDEYSMISMSAEGGVIFIEKLKEAYVDIAQWFETEHCLNIEPVDGLRRRFRCYFGSHGPRHL